MNSPTTTTSREDRVVKIQRSTQAAHITEHCHLESASEKDHACERHTWLQFLERLATHKGVQLDINVFQNQLNNLNTKYIHI